MENIKKEILNFIEKNKITKKYAEVIEKINNIDELKKYNLEIKNKKLVTYIEKLLKNSNDTPKVHYLDYDNNTFLELIQSNKIYDDNTELFNHIYKLREEQKNKLNINSYCIDSIKNVLNRVNNILALIDKDVIKRKEIKDFAKTFNVISIFSKNSIKYFSMSVEENTLSKEEKDFLHNMCKKLNIKKNIFNASEISTNKQILDKFSELIDNLVNGDENYIIDVYSYKKALSLINYFE